MVRRKQSLLAWLLTCFIGLLPPSSSLAQQPGVGLEAGMSAPEFALSDLEGKVVHLSDFRGQVIFLNFWATWCPACRFEMPTMEAVYEKFKGRGLAILAVSIDQGSEATVKRLVTAYRQEHGPMTFPVLLDPKHEVMDLYGVAFIPTHFYIDRKGRIRDKYVGPKDWRKAENWKPLEDLLAEP